MCRTWFLTRSVFCRPLYALIYRGYGVLKNPLNFLMLSLILRHSLDRIREWCYDSDSVEKNEVKILW